jgi:hypothetical protein
MFYFAKLLNMAMAGIDGTSVIPTITNIAFAILLVGFMVGLYQAAMRGGDLQALAVSATKYLVVAMIIANWASVFRSVNGSFTSAADFIGNSSGAGDMYLSWMTQLQQQAGSNPNLTFWDMITGDMAGSISVVLLLIAYIIYALAIIIFCFFYTLYGSVLYVLGPLVLAVLPVSGIGQLGKTYAINLMIWNSWAILYAIFGALITAIQVNRMNDVLGHGFLGFLEGVPDSTILGLVSIFYALSVALIPFIAKRIISGDVGSTAFSMVRAGAFAAETALAGATGFAAGLSGGAATESSAGSSAGGIGASAGMASSSPPTPPAVSMAEFLHSGFSSAASGDRAPIGPTQAASSGSGDSANDTQSSSGGPARGASFIYRPRSVTQAVTFNAARALARAAGRNNADNN